MNAIKTIRIYHSVDKVQEDRALQRHQKYPTKLCDSILVSIAKMRTTSQDDGRIKPSVRFAMPETNSDDSKYDQVANDYKNYT